MFHPGPIPTFQERAIGNHLGLLSAWTTSSKVYEVKLLGQSNIPLRKPDCGVSHVEVEGGPRETAGPSRSSSGGGP